MERSVAQSARASPSQTAPHEGHLRRRLSLSPAGCGTTIKSASLAWWATTMSGFPPDDRGKAGRGFIGIWSRLGHSQTMLGCQPLEQVADGAFPISVCSRVQHGQVRAPQSCDHDLPPRMSPPQWWRAVRAAEFFGSPSVSTPAAITRRSKHSRADQYRMRTHGWAGSTRHVIGFIGRARTDLATEKQLQPEGAAHLARNTSQTGVSARRRFHRQDRDRAERQCTTGRISQHAFQRR